MDAKELRKRSGKNQRDFWGALGATQSCGSRYESANRPLSGPMGKLLYLATANEKMALAALAELRMLVGTVK